MCFSSHDLFYKVFFMDLTISTQHVYSLFQIFGHINCSKVLCQLFLCFTSSESNSVEVFRRKCEVLLSWVSNMVNFVLVGAD